ncbi:hypothetical protein [Parenemella sanctibonifatiensis]|uniref:Uncharacterized protein n=1 Tax=Parenemella sanctibonifatiensis TaxID=2016505 RepID=A0A255EA68_9ACTN|nr:hypothetical protein [Parenemella sanctibonifatiensis]OYN88457.1 hypothetical protein CGZ92_04255 [Parenemella sanctibonifatiensis]
MEITGLIFGVIAVAWLVYLVPMYLNQRNDPEIDVPDFSARFSDRVKVVRRDEEHADDDDDDVDVITPLIRRAEKAAVARLARRAAKRRRLSLLAILSLLVGTVVAAALGQIPWWSVAIPGGGLVLFLGLSPLFVRAMHRRLDRRLASLDEASAEDTILVALDSEQVHASSMTTEFTGAIEGKTGSLWDPIPVTAPTYVSEAQAPRTVRTIDLAGPHSTKPELPPTADARPSEADETERQGAEKVQRQAADTPDRTIADPAQTGQVRRAG